MTLKFGLHVKLYYLNDYLKILGRVWHMIIAWNSKKTMSKYNACDAIGFVHVQFVWTFLVDFMLNWVIYNSYMHGGSLQDFNVDGCFERVLICVLMYLEDSN